ncbi:MAG: general secretion pathway protein GspB [Sedimentisphaerales bacterium]|nr:general secretion pathway protein GspB [Sedimentisphaerales bacterium]
MSNNMDQNQPNSDFDLQWDDQHDSSMPQDDFDQEDANQAADNVVAGLDWDQPSDNTSEDTQENPGDPAWLNSNNEPEQENSTPATGFGRGRRGQTANRNTAILLIACCAAVAAVYFIGLHHRPDTDEVAQQTLNAQLDMALNQLLESQNQQVGPDGVTDNQRLMQAFYEYPGSQQILLHELHNNPFRSLIPVVTRDEVAEQERAADRRISRIRELTNLFQRLQLEGILVSPTGPQCMINGEVFNEGDAVIDEFEIQQITPQQVILTAEQTEFLLQM